MGAKLKTENKNDMPIQPAVYGCTLQNVSVNPTYVDFTFKGPNGESLNHRVFKPNKDYFKDKYKDQRKATKEFKKEGENVLNWIGKLFATYLSHEDLIDARTYSSGFQEFLETLKEKLYKVNFSNIKVVLKTMPDKRVGVSLPRFGDFIVKDKGVPVNFYLSQYDRDLYRANGIKINQ
jgi:high-affinity Fe2+/Pb2+ permease